MADRYWVGGTATWDATAGTKWATTSGGLGGASVPTSADNVFFDILSGVGTVTTTTLGAAVFASLDTTGFAGTLALGNVDFTLNARGSITIGATTTITIGGTSARIVFDGNIGAANLTTNGKTLPQIRMMSGSGSLTLQDALNIGTATLTLDSGTLNTNGQSVTAGSFSNSNSNTRTLTLGSTSMTLSGTAASTWSGNNSTGLTITANTATVTLTGSTGGASLGGNNPLTLDYTGMSLVFSGSGTQTLACAGPISLANVTRTGTASKTSVLSIGGTSTWTITGTFTVNGDSVTNRLLVQSSTAGTARTINAAAVSASNVDFIDITGAGAASWDLSAITGGSGDAGGNSGIAFTPAVTVYRIGSNSSMDSTANWSLTSGGANNGRVPLPQDTARFDANTGTGSTVVPGALGRYGSIDFTGYTGTFNFSQACSWYGSLTLGAGMTLGSGASTQTFAGRGSHTITLNGKSLSNSMRFEAVTGTYTLTDAFATSSSLLALSGTFITSSQTVTALTFTSNGSLARTITLGTSTVTLTSSATVTIWNIASTGMTLSAETSTIIIATASANTRTFVGAGTETSTTGIYGTLTYTVAASTGVLNITGSNIFDTINVSGGPRTLRLPASTPTFVRPGGWNVNGTAGNLVTVESSTAGTPAYLSATMPDATGKLVCFNGDARTADAGVSYGYFPITAAEEYAWSPYQSVFNIANDLEIQFDGVSDDWSPPSTQALVSKYRNPQQSYMVVLSATGRVQLYLDSVGDDTGEGQHSPTTGVDNVAVDGQRVALKTTWRKSDQRMQNHYRLSNADPWTQLGTDVTHPVTSIAATTSALKVGAYGASTAPFVGKVYGAKVLDGIDGTAVLDVDFTGVPPAISSDYLSIKDIRATGHGRWYAGVNSVNVSGNSYWAWGVAPTAVGKEVGFVWSFATSTAVGTSTAFSWDVRSTVADTVSLPWDDRTAVADDVTLRWDDRAAVADTTSLVWSARTVAADTISPQWNVRESLGDTNTLRWNVRAALVDQVTLVWSARAALADQIVLRWDTRTAVADTNTLRWNVRRAVEDTGALQWGVRALVNDQAVLRWATRATLADLVTFYWNARTTVVDTTTLRWDARTVVGEDAVLRWADAAAVGDTIVLRWAARTLLADTVTASWNVRRGVAEDAVLLWDLRAVAAGEAVLLWSVRGLAANEIVLLYRVLGTVAVRAHKRTSMRSISTAMQPVDTAMTSVRSGIMS